MKMTPLRNNRVNNRANRSQIDHDIMEGLPVRQWRKQAAVVNNAPPRENPSVADKRHSNWIELPMPKGSELYSPMSQALLRAARMGQVNKPAPTPLEDEKEPGEDEEVEGELDTGYVTIKWAQLAKDVEQPEMEFLAKRRKGLPSVYGAESTPAASGPMRKTKVRKIDSDGNISVWDVLVPEGTVVEGEILEGEEVMTEAPAPGTVVEGVGIANAEGVVIAGDQIIPTPQKKKYHPPKTKRKLKGPGRGRKKPKPIVANGATKTESVPTNEDDLKAVESNLSSESIKPETGKLSVANKLDTEVRDESVAHDGDEGGEEGGDDVSEDDDDEDEEGEDGDREEGELSPSPDRDAHGSFSSSPAKLMSIPIVVETLLTDPEITTAGAEASVNRDASSSPDLPLAAAYSVPALVISVQPSEEATTVPAVSKKIFMMKKPVPLENSVTEQSAADKTTLEEHILNGSTSTEAVLKGPTGDEFTLLEPPLAARLEHSQFDESSTLLEQQPTSLKDLMTPTAPPPDPVVVEEKAGLKSAKAEVPPEHNPLDGVTAPQVTEVTEPVPEKKGIVRFPNGDEDLLGSLERHLDEKEKTT